MKKLEDLLNILLKHIGKRLKELDFKKCNSEKQRDIHIASTQELKMILEIISKYQKSK